MLIHHHKKHSLNVHGFLRPILQSSQPLNPSKGYISNKVQIYLFIYYKIKKKTFQKTLETILVDEKNIHHLDNQKMFWVNSQYYEQPNKLVRAFMN